MLGQLISVCGLLLIIGFSVREGGRGPVFAGWWTFCSCAVMLGIVCLAVLGHLLPYKFSSLLWRALPPLGFAVILLSFPAYEGGAPESMVAWQWNLAGVYVSYPVLWLRARTAVVVAIAAGFLPALSGLLAYGELPSAVGVMIPIQITNFAFTVIFSGVRAGMARYQLAELHAREQRELGRSAMEREQAESHLSRLIHDEILGTLSAALRFSDRVPDAVRAEAEKALALLADETPWRGTAAGLMPVEQFGSMLVDLAHELSPECVLEVSVETGEVPGAVAQTLRDAAAEAMRNSMRHAGPDSELTLRATIASQRIDIDLSDTGRGFELSEVGHDRLGVRESVLGRVEALEGGFARVHTASGEGTRVELRWRA